MVSEGMRAKTDRSDARMLARFGQQKQPPPSPVDSENARTLKDLVGCRDDLIKSRVMERNRLTVVGAPVRDVHEATIAFLSAQLADVDQRIAVLIAADAELAERAATLRSAPGIGPVVSAVLLARLAELGQRHAKPLAALAGVAPHTQDSGTKQGARTIGGGRPDVTKALFQMAQTATRSNRVIKAHYLGLRQRMPHKPAVIACARKMLGILNAMLRDGLVWADTEVGKGRFLPDPA